MGVSSSDRSGADGKRAPRIEAQITEIDVGLSGIFQSAGSLIGLWNEFDGTHIAMNSGALIKAVCRAARTDSRLRGWLLSVVHVSAYSDIALAASMLILPILINHGLIPERFFTSQSGDDNDQSN